MSLPSAACISAVRRPSRLTQLVASPRASVPPVPGSAARASRSSTQDQPSPSLGTKACSIERVTAPSPGAAPSSSAQPSNDGVAAKPAVSVRNRLISSSGWMPSSSLRSTFRIASSPTRMEVFDCSALLRWMAQPPPGSSPVRGSCSVLLVRSRSARETSPSRRSNLSIQARTKASTEKASTSRTSPPPWAVSAGGAMITCAGSAASAGTSASGTKRSSGACPGGDTDHMATAAGTPGTGNGSSAESATAGRPASLAGYHRCLSRKSGRATWANTSSPRGQTSASGAEAVPWDRGDACDTASLRLSLGYRKQLARAKWFRKPIGARVSINFAPPCS